MGLARVASWRAFVLVALAFAVGTTIGGYTTVAVIGVSVALIGAAGLLWVDRRL